TEAADCSWRCQRAEGVETAVLDQMVRDAKDGDPEQEARDVAALAQRIPTEPVEAVSLLKENTLGCEYLLTQWADVMRALEMGECFWPSERRRVVCLTGKRPCDLFYDRDIYEWTWYFMGYYVGLGEPTITPELAHRVMTAEERPAEVCEIEFHDRIKELID